MYLLKCSRMDAGDKGVRRMGGRHHWDPLLSALLSLLPGLLLPFRPRRLFVLFSCFGLIPTTGEFFDHIFSVWSPDGHGGGIIEGDMTIGRTRFVTLCGNLQLAAQTGKFGMQILHNLGMGGIVDEVFSFRRIFLEIVKFPLVDVGLVKMDQLVAIGHHPILGTDTVPAGILVVMVIEAGAPIGGSLPLEEGYKTQSLHVLRLGNARCR